MSDEYENKPLYYDFLKNLLRSSRINPETQQEILGMYVAKPNDFESSFDQLHRYLLFMSLRPQEARHIALAFHSQINNISQEELLEEYGYAGGRKMHPRNRTENNQNSNTGIQSMRELMQEAMQMKAQMEILKMAFQDDEDNRPRQQPQQPDYMQQMFPWMMMMSGKLNIEGEVGEDGQPRFRGFSLVPSSTQGGQSQGDPLTNKLLEKTLTNNDMMQQYVFQGLMTEKDGKIQELENKINYLAQQNSTENTIGEFEKWLDFQQRFGMGGAGGGNLQGQIELQRMKQEHDLRLKEIENKFKDSDFHRELALQEFRLSAEEKRDQRQISQQALEAISNNVNNVISKVAGPAMQYAGEGISEGMKESSRRLIQGEQQQQQSQSGSEVPDLDSMTPEQLMEAKRRAEQTRQNFEQGIQKMQEYERVFEERLSGHQEEFQQNQSPPQPQEPVRKSRFRVPSRVQTNTSPPRGRNLEQEIKPSEQSAPKVEPVQSPAPESISIDLEPDEIIMTE